MMGAIGRADANGAGSGVAAGANNTAPAKAAPVRAGHANEKRPNTTWSNAPVRSGQKMGTPVQSPKDADVLAADISKKDLHLDDINDALARLIAAKAAAAAAAKTNDAARKEEASAELTAAQGNLAECIAEEVNRLSRPVVGFSRSPADAQSVDRLIAEAYAKKGGEGRRLVGDAILEARAKRVVDNLKALNDAVHDKTLFDLGDARAKAFIGDAAQWVMAHHSADGTSPSACRLHRLDTVIATLRSAGVQNDVLEALVDQCKQAGLKIPKDSARYIQDVQDAASRALPVTSVTP